MTKRSYSIVAILVSAEALILVVTMAVFAGYWYASIEPLILSGERTKAELLSSANLGAVEEAVSSGDRDRLEAIFGRILLLSAPETQRPMVRRIELKLRDGTSLVRPPGAGQLSSSVLAESPVFSSESQEFLGTLRIHYDEGLYRIEVRQARRVLLLAAGLLVILNGALLILLWLLLHPLSLLATALRRADAAEFGILPVLQRFVTSEIHHVDTALRDLLGRLADARRREKEQADRRALDLEERVAERERTGRELNRLNQALIARSEELTAKNEEVESFVYAVSHDLRAPLVNLQGFSAQLEISCRELRQSLSAASLPEPDGAKVQKVLEDEIPGDIHYITASIDKFDRLISALLKLSRIGRRELRMEVLPMDDIAGAAVDSIRRLLDASGAVVRIASLPPAWGDSTTIGQVLSNLVTNAAQYLVPGRPGIIEIGGESKDGMNHYWVRDNGRGLPAGAQEKLFQVFQRFQPDVAPGEGLGLMIVKRGVERHGGRVWAESQEGAGCTFHFLLPRQPSAGPELGSGSAAPAADLHREVNA